MAIYIIMGVSGVGKTTIGKLLSEQLNSPFYDADDFHPPENIAKMKSGKALNDGDRAGWLKLLAKNIAKWHKKEGGAVLACSALKEKYRQQLSSAIDEDLHYIFLKSDFETIKQRLELRKTHYFKPKLLASQFETLEEPEYGLHLNAAQNPELILEEIMSEITEKSQIGLIGLGVMGKSLALNLASKGFKVSVYNREVKGTEEKIAARFVDDNPKLRLKGFNKVQPFLNSLNSPRNIILMVNAGETIDLVLDNLLSYLEKEDLIVDGGNSHYKDTIRREQDLKKKGIYFIGTGISGGEEGALKGPSIMPGGNKTGYGRIEDFLEKIAARDKNGDACCTYIGPNGAGHFVKMLHNGIEYAEMQLIAEIYHSLRFGMQKSPEEISRIFSEWNKELQSYLLEISTEILLKKEDDELLLDKILDAAKQKGTGGWSTNAALELGVPLDTISTAVMARIISGKKQDREQAASKYKMDTEKNHLEINTVFKAYKSASIINHAIGFDLLQTASENYDWNLNYSEIARLWTNGCIIRSALMQDLAEIFKHHQGHLLLQDDISEELLSFKKDFSTVITGILQAGMPLPVLSAAYNYFLSFTSAQTSANIIQAQRDYFGAHTYERKDRPRGEFFHTNWKKYN